MKAFVIASGVSANDGLPCELPVHQAAARMEEDTVLWWFSYKDILGRHGYRYMPLGAQLALAATRAALNNVEAPQSRSLWLATSTYGAIHEMFNVMSFSAGPEAIGPATAPYFSANLLGARVAEEYQCQAGACMFSDPVGAGLHALEAAINGLDAGRGEEALVVAAEAPTENVQAQVGGGQFAAALVLGHPRNGDSGGKPASMLTIERSPSDQGEVIGIELRIGSDIFIYPNASSVLRLIAWASHCRQAVEMQVRLRCQNIMITLNPDCSRR